MRRILISLMFLFCAQVATIQAEDLARVVAVVNSEAITSLQLDKANAEQGGGAETRRQTLDRLIEEALLRQRAEEIGLRVADEEVDAAVQDVLRQNRITIEQLGEALRQQGVGLVEYRESLRRQILRFRVVGREIQGKLEVSSREVRTYYEGHQGEFSATATVGLKRLTFPFPADESERGARQKVAAEAARRLSAGEGFDAVAAAYVADGGEGVEIGTVREDELTPAFAEAIRPLPVGGCSSPVEAGGALHLLVLTSRTPGKVQPLDEVRDAIRAKLAEQKKAGAAKSWLDDLKRKAHLEVLL